MAELIHQDVGNFLPLTGSKVCKCTVKALMLIPIRAATSERGKGTQKRGGGDLTSRTRLSFNCNSATLGVPEVGSGLGAQSVDIVVAAIKQCAIDPKQLVWWCSFGSLTTEVCAELASAQTLVYVRGLASTATDAVGKPVSTKRASDKTPSILVIIPDCIDLFLRGFKLRL